MSFLVPRSVVVPRGLSLMMLVVVGASGGCAASAAPESVTDESEDALRDPETCTVSVTVSTAVAAPTDDVYDYVAREDTPARDLHPYRIVPGVRGDRLLTPGGWDYVGATREVLLDGGASCIESLDALDRPSHFAYHSRDYSFPLGLFIREARGTWRFQATDRGAGAATDVAWTYTFVPRACAKKPELHAFVDAFFRPYMEQAMRSISRHIVEREAAPAAP